MTDCKEKALFDIFLAANVFAKKLGKKKEEEAKDAARYFERVLYSLGPLVPRIESSDHISLLCSTKNTDPSGVFLKKKHSPVFVTKKNHLQDLLWGYFCCGKNAECGRVIWNTKMFWQYGKGH